MKKRLLFLLLAGMTLPLISQSGIGKLKGDGQIFYTETFGWENPNDPRGWTPPEGFYFEDPTDNGYNWHWYANDSLVSQWVNEPPMLSTTRENGHLCLYADRYNEWKDPTIPLDNSIVFPVMDCSSHSSVIIRYETCFMNYSTGWQMLLEVTTDGWSHKAIFDVGFGCGHKGRPNNNPPGIPAIFEANISDVAAGMPNVQFKFTWRETDDYFWLIDDLTLAEAWDNDLQMKSYSMEWIDSDANTTVTPFFMMPKSQLNGGFYDHFSSSVLNFGEYDQEDVKLTVSVTKNSQVVYEQSGPEKFIQQLILDTTSIDIPFTPLEFGHYKVNYTFTQTQQENTPENNMAEVYFNVTDSAYSHADDTSDESFCWGFEAYGDGPNIDHGVATIYPIYADCEVNSISAFISGGKADGMIDFRFKLFKIPAGSNEDVPVEVMSSETLELDSSMLGSWLTLPFEKDGESEFLVAGDIAYACVEYSNMHEDQFSRRYQNLQIGSDHSFRILDRVCDAKEGPEWAGADVVTRQNLMIRLNINDHSNIIDAVTDESLESLLKQNYPNPFSQNTTISFELNKGSEASLIIRDLTGRIVMEYNEGYLAEGDHKINVEASSLEGGIYFYTLKAGDLCETKRMTIIR